MDKLSQLQHTSTITPVPRKLNPGMIQALSECVSKGNYAVTACQLCGISEHVYYEWLTLASKDQEAGLSEVESIYIRLAQSIKNAEAIAEENLVEQVRQWTTEKKDQYAAMMFLERRHPDRWGRRDSTKVDITEKREVKITHVEVHLTDNPMRQLPEGEIIEQS